MSAAGWKLVHGGRMPPRGAVVRPGERLLAPRMPGPGAQPGVRIWIENVVNFADPVNLVPLAAGIIAGIGNLTIKFTSTFSITGIAAGRPIVILGHHGVRPFARRPLDEPQAGNRAYEGGS